MSISGQDLLNLLDKNAQERDLATGEDAMLTLFDVPTESIREAVTADVMDTLENILPKIVAGEVTLDVGGDQPVEGGVLTTEMMASMLAAHSHLWFVLGLRVASDAAERARG